jgi:hypothetical protein
MMIAEVPLDREMLVDLLCNPSNKQSSTFLLLLGQQMCRLPGVHCKSVPHHWNAAMDLQCRSGPLKSKDRKQN